ncbi:aspartate aminotransferase family protein [Aestuariispira insulae]|uniref:Glutamate-1-semialdehyde 2,1-aminomutase n=1 Tax=Aestuariispira insulae TaxID=1461337 RepID=A0A3D9HFS9_9PROT|nr:aspartate aminotransferase family protein [Aestuariispira insulae]RED48111.1 glutamate-1-semialdehyde 2,1-aminomutase [Aestuariispira insulae]
MDHGNGVRLGRALAGARARYVDRCPKSYQAFQEALSVMPGGNTRTVLFHEPYPFRAATGEGSWLIDADGNRLLNLLGEYTAGLFGHDHPEIQLAIRTALQGGINLGAHHSIESKFAQLLVSRFPALEKVRFTNSGTEATLMALTAARAHTGRDKILVFEGGYHGGVFLFKPDISTNAPFSWEVCPFNDVKAAVTAIRSLGPELAAVMVEPMLGSGGCVPARPDFLAALRRESDAAGCLLIFDEVMTSRLGEEGGQGLYGIFPDLMTVGKWIGGGMSFGAFGGRAEVMDLFDPRRPDAIAHAGTFNNNVLTMHAGVAALGRIYTAKHAFRFNAWGDKIRERLNQTAIDLEIPFQISGLGSLMCLHPGAGPIENYRDVMRRDDRLRELVFLDLLEEGYYIARRGFIALSLTLTQQEIDRFVDAFRRVLERRSDLLREHLP